MARCAGVAGIEFGLPFVEQRQRGRGVAYFVAQIVGDAAIGVDVEEILAEVFGEEPSGDGKIFVVGAGEAAAVFLGLFERRGRVRDCVFGGQRAPAERRGGGWDAGISGG